MKRSGHIYEKIYDKKNLMKAYQKAKAGKGYYKEVLELEDNLEAKLDELQQMLINQTYKTSDYIKFIKYDGRNKKERVIYKLPFYPDRIVHWAIMLQIEDILVDSFIYDTYSAIPKRGMSLGKKRIEMALKDEINTQYCFKFDIKHYYQSINHNILLNLFKHKFKDKKLLQLLEEIINSISTAEMEDLQFLYGIDSQMDYQTGIPIGNYLSQYCGNFYLSQLDHFAKEHLHIKYYFRYMDDCVILSSSKEELWFYKQQIEEFLWNELKLKYKSNWQIFPVEARGIDFLGYRFFHKFILLRKLTKQSIIQSTSKAKKSMTIHNANSVISLYGWIKDINSYRLRKKYFQPLSYKYSLFRFKEWCKFDFIRTIKRVYINSSNKYRYGFSDNVNYQEVVK